MREQAIDIRLALRTALLPLRDPGRILAYLRQAESLAAPLDDPSRLGQVAVHLSTHFRLMGAYDQAMAAAQHALALAMASGEAVLHALANRYLGLVYHAQGDYRQAIDCFRQTLVSLDGARRRERLGQVHLPTVSACAYLAECHARLGLFIEGRALGEEGLRLAEAVDHPATLMIALWGTGLLSLQQGNLPRALPLLERAMGICQDTDLSIFFPWMTAALGAAYTLGGRSADAVPLLTQALAQTTAPDMVGLQALCCLPLGEAHLLTGLPEKAHALAKQAQALARAHQERGNQAYALRLLGDIAAHRNPPEYALAEAHYQQALALADALGMRPLQAHCHRSLGTLYSRVGRAQQAHLALGTAIELYRAIEMTFWLPQAEAALAYVGAAPEPQAG